MNDKTRSMTEIVAKYLHKCPDFLIKHPEVLEALELPHESGGAVSLIEKQVERLREQNSKLNRQLGQLIRVASENEQLMSRLHHLTLDLMVVEDLGEFFDRLILALKSEFNADILNFSLIDRKIETPSETPVYFVRSDDKDFQQFQALLDKGETTCGRLNDRKLEFLFGSRAQWVQSTALVPLGDVGLMAIGSSDPARFYPGLGTLFLDLLAGVVINRLSLAEPQDHRRTA
ncbi:MAG: hypothetical protein ACI9H8_001432 [Lysobacterales bacterium]|jgi:uncharacterized protein YigA (DUF484 family)